MKNLAHKSKLMLAFVSGALCVGLLQVTPLKASTTSLTGSCVSMGNYSNWGWPASSGSSKEYSEVGILNFDTQTSSAIINEATANPSNGPTYREGLVEDATFTIQSGPISGTFKLVWDDGDYTIAAPANGGNTIFFLDTKNGMTGVCQKI